MELKNLSEQESPLTLSTSMDDQYLQKRSTTPTKSEDLEDLSEKLSQTFLGTKEFKKQNLEQQSEEMSSTKEVTEEELKVWTEESSIQNEKSRPASSKMENPEDLSEKLLRTFLGTKEFKEQNLEQQSEEMSSTKEDTEEELKVWTEESLIQNEKSRPASSKMERPEDLSKKPSKAFANINEFEKENLKKQSVRSTEKMSSTEAFGGNNSELEIQHVSIRDRAVTDEDILKMAGKITSSSSKKISIEFYNCCLRDNHLDLFCDEIKNAHCQITSFTISYTENIDALLEKICLIVQKYKATNLCLECDGLSDKSIKLFREYLKHEKIKTLESLDISYNFEISAVGFELLGEIMRKSNIVSLEATDCDITDEKLKKFLGALNGVQLNKLSIGCNEELTNESFRTLAEFVGKRSLNRLEMSGCEISKENINVFNEFLPQTRKEPLLKELDINYNSTIGPDSSLGSIVLKCGVTKLSMAGCKLEKQHLIHLGNEIENHEMDLINLRDNASIGQDIEQIAKFGRVREINICDCMFSAHQLRSYREALDGERAKVSCLHLGDQEREPDEKYIDELCALLKNVEDVLYLRFHKMSDAFRVSLRANCRNSTEIRLTVSEGNEQEQWENKRKRTETNIINSPIEQVNIQQGRSPQKQLPGVKKSGRKAFQTEIIEGEFVSLCGRSKFVEALFCIQQLTPEQREKVGTNTFLLLSQCYAELDRDDEANIHINKLTHLFMTSTSDVDDIINTANHLLNDKSYFRALVLFRIASDMYTHHPSLSADEIVHRILDCVVKMHIAVKRMIESGGRSKVIALKYGCVYLSEMVENLRAVEKADSAYKATQVANCVNWIGNNYRSAREHEKSIEFYKTGVDIMERQFGKNYSKYRIYGILLNNLGVSNCILDRYSIAEDYYIKALDANNNASDFRNEDEKQKCIVGTQTNLKIIREK